MVAIIRKWDYKTKQYIAYITPATIISVYSDDLDQPVDCANCGLRMTYAVGYTSKTLHNMAGFGFSVCEKCYKEECEEEKAND